MESLQKILVLLFAAILLVGVAQKIKAPYPIALVIGGAILGFCLVNDASALVLYKLAVTAILSGTFSWFDGGIEFIKVVTGGIAVGAALGVLFQQFSKRYLEPVLGVVFSFTIPYIIYIAANYIGVSGVLAVVVSGLIGSRILLTHQSSLRRILGYATWDIFTILLNCFVFIIIGIQLRTVTGFLTPHEMFLYSGYALLIAGVMLLVRMFWVYAKSGLTYLKAK